MSLFWIGSRSKFIIMLLNEYFGPPFILKNPQPNTCNFSKGDLWPKGTGTDIYLNICTHTLSSGKLREIIKTTSGAFDLPFIGVHWCTPLLTFSIVLSSAPFGVVWGKNCTHRLNHIYGTDRFMFTLKLYYMNKILTSARYYDRWVITRIMSKRMIKN